MKLGQVMSFLDVGLVPEEYREEFQRKLGELRDAAPKVRFSDMRKVVETELGEKLGDAFAEFDETPIAAASIGQVYRAPPARRPRGRGQGPVPRRRPGGAGRHAEPRDDPAAAEADRAGARRQGDRRGGAQPHRRRARLRARGAEPALDGAHLPRPPVHRRARRRDLADAREGDRLRVRLRARLRRHQAARPGDAQPRRRDGLPLLLRLHVPPPPVLRRPPPRQLPADGRRQGRVPRLRPLQGDAERRCSRSSSPASAPATRATARSSSGSGPRPASSSTRRTSAPTSCSRSSATRPGGTCSTRTSSSSPRSPPRS